MAEEINVGPFAGALDRAIVDLGARIITDDAEAVSVITQFMTAEPEAVVKGITGYDWEPSAIEFRFYVSGDTCIIVESGGYNAIYAATPAVCRKIVQAAKCIAGASG